MLVPESDCVRKRVLLEPGCHHRRAPTPPKPELDIGESQRTAFAADLNICIFPYGKRLSFKYASAKRFRALNV